MATRFFAAIFLLHTLCNKMNFALALNLSESVASPSEDICFIEVNFNVLSAGRKSTTGFSKCANMFVVRTGVANRSTSMTFASILITQF